MRHARHLTIDFGASSRNPPAASGRPDVRVSESDENFRPRSDSGRLACPESRRRKGRRGGQRLRSVASRLDSDVGGAGRFRQMPEASLHRHTGEAEAVRQEPARPRSGSANRPCGLTPPRPERRLPRRRPQSPALRAGQALYRKPLRDPPGPAATVNAATVNAAAVRACGAASGPIPCGPPPSGRLQGRRRPRKTRS